MKMLMTTTGITHLAWARLIGLLAISWSERSRETPWRERERKRETDRQTDRDRETVTDRQTDKQTETERHREGVIFSCLFH